MKELKKLILSRLNGEIQSFENGGFKYWVIDDLLPVNIATKISEAFPPEKILRQRDSLREYKRVGIEFENYDPLMEQITYVFHEVEIVERIQKITGFQNLVPDINLYAGGLSSMTKNSFLNPHLDNSHDDTKSMFRVLNLLYYVSKDWKVEDGGNLMLFLDGINKLPITVVSSFNRLVIMETHDKSFHGVSKVTNESPRRCVSNYYFSKYSTNAKDYEHVTSFFPFPEETVIKKFFFIFDRNIRQSFSAVYKSIINYKNWHKR